jgi:hypothetical protein
MTPSLDRRSQPGLTLIVRSTGITAIASKQTIERIEVAGSIGEYAVGHFTFGSETSPGQICRSVFM